MSPAVRTSLRRTLEYSQEQQYSALDVNRAKKARKLQETMGFISERDLIQVVDNNLIQDSKV